jgi:hypothetical protein
MWVIPEIRLTRDGGGKVSFRGSYAAVVEDEALDFSVLGRDILSLFAVYGVMGHGKCRRSTHRRPTIIRLIEV